MDASLCGSVAHSALQCDLRDGSELVEVSEKLSREKLTEAWKFTQGQHFSTPSLNTI